MFKASVKRATNVQLTCNIAANELKSDVGCLNTLVQTC